MTLFTRFQDEIKKNKQITKSDRILVAFSGGKDSVCLLFLLLELRERFHFDLGACHVHHGIRGSEADEDLAFCRDFCMAKNVPFYAEYIDTPTFAKSNGLGLEESARILRYDALAKVATKDGYNKIATAHTASDQAETILLHLIRGSGFHGMRGIPSRRGNIIRPLLPFYKEEILAFLNNLHIEFKEDSTNADTIYSRNRLRANILPEIKKINPMAERSLVRFSEIAEEQSALVAALCSRWETENAIEPESGSIPLKPLVLLIRQEAMIPILREALSRMAKKEEIVIDFQHYKSLISLLKSPSEGKIIEIAKGFSFWIENNSLRFGKHDFHRRRIEYQVKLCVGENVLPIPNTVLKLSDKRRGKVINVNKKLLIISAAFDKIEGVLFARNRKDGDQIRIGGMNKSLKKVFQEAKIPLKDRDRIPLICDDLGIVWIPYVGLCDRVRESECDEIFTMELCKTDLALTE